MNTALEKRNSMDFNKILEKKNIFQQGKKSIDAITLSSYEKDFELTFTHNSTAIEGNTLTLMETKVVLEEYEKHGDIKRIINMMKK